MNGGGVGGGDMNGDDTVTWDQAMADLMPGHLWVVDVDDMSVRHANNTMWRTLGVTPSGRRTVGMDAILGPAAIEKLRAEALEALGRGGITPEDRSPAPGASDPPEISVELPYRTRAGGQGWVKIRGRVRGTQQEGPRQLWLIGTDVTDEVEARIALAASEERFRMAMDSAPIGMAVLDLDRRFRQVNPALCHMLEVDAQWILHRRMADVVAPGSDALDLRMRAAAVSGFPAPADRTLELLTSTGRRILVEASVGVLVDDDGLPTSYVSQFADVTAVREAQDRLLYLATHDALTSMANRYALSERMDAIVARGVGAGVRLAVLFIDVDGLKAVNDDMGHDAGDDLLIEIARRISGSIGPDDLVARIGGDEFIVALTGARSLAHARDMADVIRAAVKAPLTLRGADLRPTVSVGIAVTAAGQSADHAIRQADQALYQAKRAGRDTAVLFDSGDEGSLW